MRKRLTAAVCLLAVICAFLLCGCSSQLTEQTQYPTERAKIDKYFKDASVVKSTDFETVYVVDKMMGMNMSMGPSDPRYRGVIVLKEDFAKEYFTNCTWKSSTQAIPAFVNISTKPFYSDTWYEYDDTDFDFFESCIVNTFLFNGKDTILFDVSTF